MPGLTFGEKLTVSLYEHGADGYWRRERDFALTGSDAGVMT